MLQTFIFMYSFSCLEIVSWEQPILSTVLIYICWEILNVWNVHMRKQARLMIHYLKNKGILSLFSFCYNPVSQCHKRILLCLSQKLTLLHSPSPIIKMNLDDKCSEQMLIRKNYWCSAGLPDLKLPFWFLFFFFCFFLRFYIVTQFVYCCCI